MRMDREPHIGEYASKTNAICEDRLIPAAPLWRRPARDGGGFSRGLLPVVLQHLVAGFTQLGTILLQAGQNGEIALIDHGAAKTLNVAGTSLLLLRGAAALLLSDGTG